MYGFAPTAIADGLIAATALAYGIKPVTGSIADFRLFEMEIVAIVNPWTE